MTSTLALEGGMEWVSYHLPVPPSNAMSTSEAIEQIKLILATINDKFLRHRRSPLKVSSWQTLAFSALELTRALVINALAANPIPLLSTAKFLIALLATRALEKPSTLNQKISTRFTNTSANLGAINEAMLLREVDLQPITIYLLRQV